MTGRGTCWPTRYTDHGVPTITLDPASTPQEIACQVILKGYWHGYIEADEPALARAVATAYPKPVEQHSAPDPCPNQGVGSCDAA